MSTVLARRRRVDGLVGAKSRADSESSWSSWSSEEYVNEGAVVESGETVGSSGMQWVVVRARRCSGRDITAMSVRACFGEAIMLFLKPPKLVVMML